MTLHRSNRGAGCDPYLTIDTAVHRLRRARTVPRRGRSGAQRLGW
jgi:hypothetical protein